MDITVLTGSRVVSSSELVRGSTDSVAGIGAVRDFMDAADSVGPDLAGVVSSDAADLRDVVPASLAVVDLRDEVVSLVAAGSQDAVAVDSTVAAAFTAEADRAAVAGSMVAEATVAVTGN